MAEKHGMNGVAAAYAAVTITLLGAWQLSALLFPDFLLPDTWDVVRRLLSIVGTKPFLEGFARSIVRLAAGYGIAIVLGTAAGLIAGAWNAFRLYLRALISVLQAIPPVTWIPLLVILLGFSDIPVVIVVGISGFFPAAQTVMGAAEGVRELHIRVARTLGGSRSQIVRTVYLPEVFPAIVSGAQIAFGNAWRSLVAAEMIGGVGIGLGWSIGYSGEVADMAGVLSYIVVIGLLAAIIDRVFLERMKRALLRWRYA